MKMFVLCISLFLSQIAVAESVKESINRLEQGSSFAYVDLGLTDRELDLLDQLKFDQLQVGDTVQYDRFGDLHLLGDELPNFLKIIGNDNEDVIKVTTEVISKIVHDVVSASNKNSAWVCVRASTPMTAYDIPRWHIDGAYYGPFPYPGLIFKFAATLKGSPTLLYNLSSDQRDVFIAHQNDRKFLSEFLDLSSAESPQRGEGVIFIVADQERGAIHSEPKKHENRLFFSILPGDKSEIEELNLRWHPSKT